MLNILRKVRFKLIGKSRLSQYVFYALGEVFLVIVGILIAVYLNNVNEQRKEQREVDSLLKQVQTELDANIQRVNGLYLSYGVKDSLIYHFLNEIIPSQQIEDRYLGLYTSVTLNYGSVEIESDAYEALMKKAEYFPERYEELIQNLKSIYGQSANSIENFLTLIAESISDELAYLSTTQPWYADFFYRGNISPEVKPFILNDVRFINQRVNYVTFSSSNLVPTVLGFKQQAVEAYRQIEALVPKSAAETDTKASFEYDLADYESWLGTYRDPADSDTVRLVEEEGRLRMLWRGSNFEIFPLNRQDFNVELPFFMKVNYNADKTVKEFTGHYPNDRFVYEKLD